MKHHSNKQHVLKGSYEEAVTSLIGNLGRLGYKQLPLRLYQVGNKFREEQRPKHGHGLMRSYSFDFDRSSALTTYQEFTQIYKELFQAIGVAFTTVEANAGNIGGSLSHEYKTTAEIGEYQITYEEAVTSLIANLGRLGYKQLPHRLYQVRNKFREEQRPKDGHGLMRSKEFLMKDSALTTYEEFTQIYKELFQAIGVAVTTGYSFDFDRSSALTTYQEFTQIYKELFQAIGVAFTTVEANAGNIGGSLSHEYKTTAEIGEYQINGISNMIGIGKGATGDDGKYGLHFTASNVVGNKFREEQRPKHGHGLMRSKEFLMKDSRNGKR
ncbi:Proline--tRNA ligase [Pseudolycoriella hygida]|uniref:Proline--tRNA ligase n=1 Tax=Pseudolycoriella hygida TaxID=35572 RepID=A0A9Q0NFG8_9DIPT|nr:Proline--tRNA ligase [Pseudolycoriella hygida]